MPPRPTTRGSAIPIARPRLGAGHFDSPITSIAERRLGSMMIAHGGDRFATQVAVGGDGIDSYCFIAMFRGRAKLIQHGHETTAAALAASSSGHSPHADPDGRCQCTPDISGSKPRRWSMRWKAAVRTSRLQARDRLDQRARRQPQRSDRFSDGRDQAAGEWPTTRSHWRPLTDLMVSLVLRGVPHNYLERLGSGRFGAVPAYVRRADDFMRANAAVSIRMDQVASAAGCSVRTLNAVFRRFRDTTPLAALYRIRFEQVRAELSHSVTGASIGEVSRRFGFTNPGRFAAAYRRRFGKSPAETFRRRLGLIGPRIRFPIEAMNSLPIPLRPADHGRRRAGLGSR